MTPNDFDAAHAAGAQLQNICHRQAFNAGWWTSPENDFEPAIDLLNEVRVGSRFGLALIAEKLALIHSEVSEGLEGLRKDLRDDKLPHRDMLEVELADAVIRIMDLAGAMNYDLGEAISEKLDYNSTREDHKPENRAKAGGKAL